MERTRRPDIDWLRVGATYLLFAFHVGKVFDPAPFYHVRNADLSFAMLVFCGFVGLWHMPLFFLLAGWSACASLARRGTGAFVRERLQRLAIPLVAGSIVFGPAIKYLELRSGLDLDYAGLRVAPALQDGFKLVIPGGLPPAPPFDETFRAFLPTFFVHLERFTWSHLWFVAYLLTLTLLWLPVLARILRRRDRFRSATPLALYLPIVPLAVIQLTMRARWPGIQNLFDDWANVAYYSVYLLGGFLLAAHPALERLVEREWRRSLALGVATSIALLLAVLGVVSSTALLLVGSAVAGWCFVVALVGIARRFFTTSNATLDYLSESAFPVYVLHQAAIVLPGYVVVQLPLGIAAKFALLLVTSVTLTLGVYHWLVRPFAVPRFLLGMRPKVCPLRRPVALAPATTAMVVVAGLLLAGGASAASPIGRWYAEGGAAEVAVAPCDRKLCGRVVSLRSPFDENGCGLRDRNNPEPTLRRRPVLGLEILTGLEPSHDGIWTNGSIYDPTSGNVYTCQLALDGEDRLRVRGYIGIPLFGRTTTWIRVGSEDRVCREEAP